MDNLTHDLGALDGDPAHDALYYHTQQESVDCMDADIADIVNEATGTHLTDEDIVNEATHTASTVFVDADGHPLPAYDPSSGSSLQDAPELLAAHGVTAVYTDDQVASAQGGEATGMAALEEQLAAGHHVIAGVDADTLWNALGLENTVDAHGANHAVEVTGVDTATNTVYLNDTGTPNGAAEAVPMSVFEQAWQTSNHAMVTTVGDQLHADPLAVPGPTLPVVSADPFMPHASADVVLFGGAAAAIGVGGAALLGRNGRAAAVANTTALINRVRGTKQSPAGGTSTASENELQL